MKVLRGNVFLTVIITLLSFLSVGYVACNKDETTPSVDLCDKMSCKNGATCFKGICTCTAGFEGDTCQIKWITRYLGRWDIKETVTNSNIKSNIGTQKQYIWTIRADASNASMFFIDDMAGEAAFDDVQSQIGGVTGRLASDFDIRLKALPGDTLKRQIMKGKGVVNSTGTMMNGVYYISYVKNSLPTSDTVSFEGTYYQ